MIERYAARPALGLILGAAFGSLVVSALDAWMGKPIVTEAALSIYAIWGLFGATMGACSETSIV